MDDRSMFETSHKVLKALDVKNPRLLGKGGEGYIFSFTDDTVIKIYHHATEEYLLSLKKLQALITSKHLPFTTPQIKKIGNVDSTYYTIEKKLHGVLMEDKFPSLAENEKYILLRSYYEAINALNDIELSELPFGNILEIPNAITDSTWPGFLIRMLDFKIQTLGNLLKKDVNNLDIKMQFFKKLITNELSVEKKSLVHADYFVNQVLVSEKNEISALLDISAHTVVGDRRLDMASIFFFDGMKNYTKEHLQFLTDLTIKDYGKSILRFNDIYRLYYSFYFSDVYIFMPGWYKQLIKNLNNEKIWDKIGSK